MTCHCLRNDDRGAILVMGLGMCAVLVGLLWYVIGVGDILWFRERAQEAADTAAFSGAVVHARGMNLIVLVNVLMAAILSIRVVLKFLQIVLGVAIAIAAVAAFFIGPGPLEAATEAEVTVTRLLQRTKAPIDNAIKGLHANALAIAKTVPPMAFSIGTAMAGHLDERDGVRTTTGGALLRRQDAIIDRGVAPDPKSINLNDLASDGGGVLPSFVKPLKGFSLPVASDKPEQLCRMAAGAMGDLLDNVLDKIGLGAFKIITDIIKNAAEGIAGSASEFFCENGSSGGSTPPKNIVPTVPDDQLRSKCEGDKAAADAASKSGDASFDVDKCIQDQKDKIDGAVTDHLNGAGGGGSTGDKSKMTSLKLVSHDKTKSFLNGGEDAQILALIRLKEANDIPLLGEGPRGVRVATFGGKADPPSLFRYAFAQAEFFYDNGGAWDDLVTDAMWNFRWRARLRRVSPDGSLEKLAVVRALSEDKKVAEAAARAAASPTADSALEAENFTKLARALEHPVVH